MYFLPINMWAKKKKEQPRTKQTTLESEQTD